jgi:hypothetical protein
MKNLICKEQELTLKEQAQQVLGKKVISAKQINSNTVAAQVVEQGGHQEYVTLANGMVVPIVENRKQRKARLAMVKRSLKKGRKQ